MQRYRKILKYAKKCVTLHRFLILIDMKKGFVLAFLVMSLAVSAQTVNPLTIELGNFNLDSLRTLYSAEPTMYRASLEVLEQNVQKQLDAVALVKKEIKAEQNHAKEVANSLKVASKMTAAMKKLYSKEEAELKAMQKTVDKQQKSFAKQKDLNQDTRDSYNLFLENEQKELSYSLRELADRQRKDAGFLVKDINMDAYMEARRLTQEFIDDFLGLYINPANRISTSLLVGCGLPGGMMGSMMSDQIGRAHV